MLAGRLELEFDTAKSLDVAPLRRSIARRFLRITRALAKIEGMCSQEGLNSSLTTAKLLDVTPLRRSKAYKVYFLRMNDGNSNDCNGKDKQHVQGQRHVVHVC